jgi:protein-tyrosine phosphatase
VAFRVLFVCTGNICRSPMAERLLLSRLGSQDAVLVESAGTAALVGWPMDAPSATALRELGGDPSGHAGQRLSAEQVRAADLVLTAETAHRSAVLALEPMAFRRTFTMREFARLGAGLAPLATPPGPEVLRARVAAVADQRGQAEPAEPGADDVGDPFGAAIETARGCAAQIAQAVDGVLAALGLRGADEARVG